MDNAETCPCGLCGKPTKMTGTKRCDFCWELERRVQRDPDLARAVLEKMDPTAAGGFTLGEVFDGKELPITGGQWIELNTPDHGGCAFIVWTMSDGNGDDACRVRAVDMVRRLNDNTSSGVAKPDDAEGLLREYMAFVATTCISFPKLEERALRFLAALATQPAAPAEVVAPGGSQIITLCGSARFERLFKAWNEALTMAGHTVFSLTAYPSDKAGVKQWYTEEQKAALDAAHFRKIEASDAIFVLNLHAYMGESTLREVEHAKALGKTIYFLESWGKGNGIGGSHTDEAQRAVEADGLTLPTASPIDTTVRGSDARDPWGSRLLPSAGALRYAIVDMTKAAALASPAQAPTDPIRVACVTLDGSTLTVPVDQIGDVLHGEDDQHTYTLTFKTMTRAEFDALGEFNGF